MKYAGFIWFLLIFSVLFSVNISAYSVTYIMQNTISSPDANVTVPSVFWRDSCTVNMILYANAADNTPPYNLNHQYFSPASQNIGSSTKTRESNISCQIQNSDPIQSTTSLNNLYESSVLSSFTSETLSTYLITEYVCDANSQQNFVYNSTNIVDTYGNHPFGYYTIEGQCCAQSPSQCTNDLTGDVNSVIDYVLKGYYQLCGEDLTQDRESISSNGCNAGGIQSDMDMNFWTVVPFNSMGAGIINISINAFDFSRLIGGGGTFSTNSQYYLYDIETNSTEDLGTTFPTTIRKNLVPNRDYWLFVGTRYFIDNHNWGSTNNFIFHNSTDYNISIYACEPVYVCGEYGNCSGNIQTRTCTDISDCNVPDIVEERSCFDVPEFDLTLGFEEVNEITDGVYICTQNAFGLNCLTTLSTINARYPVNWTVVELEDLSGINRANFLTMSEETASVGSRSLKMWYIPPKLNEPINDGAGGTICGNLSSGRVPEVNHPYNETLFVSSNFSFASPFAQLRYNVRKCISPVLQYDYTGDFFGLNCGKLCYSKSCNGTATGEPLGRYGVRLSIVGGQTITTIENFNFFDDDGNDGTTNVTDGDADTFVEFPSNLGATVNSTTNIFSNGTILNFLVNATGSIDLCILNNSFELESVNIPAANTLYTFNISLGNLSASVNQITIEECAPPSRTIYMRTFEVINVENVTTQQILFDYVGQAPETWDEGDIIHDFSNIGLQTGVNYTLSFSINPNNQYDPLTHCVYFDNVRVTFTELALPDCESKCIEDSINRQIGELSNGVCTFTIQTNSPDCIGDSTDRETVDNILQGLGGGLVTDNSTCIDSDNDGIRDDLYSFDTLRGTSIITIVLNCQPPFLAPP